MKPTDWIIADHPEAIDEVKDMLARTLSRISDTEVTQRDWVNLHIQSAIFHMRISGASQTDVANALLAFSERERHEPGHA